MSLSSPAVKLRLRFRYRSGNGFAFLPEKDVKTEDMSPFSLFFREAGDVSVARSRLLILVHFPA